MNTPSMSTTRARRAAEWRERIGRHASSGLDVTTFCALEAVSKANFYRWRTLIRDELETSNECAAFIDLGAVRPATSTDVNAAIGDELAPGMLEVNLDLGHGLTLRIMRR
jgi:hypothetical protein